MKASTMPFEIELSLDILPESYRTRSTVSLNNDTACGINKYGQVKPPVNCIIILKHFFLFLRDWTHPKFFNDNFYSI